MNRGQRRRSRRTARILSILLVSAVVAPAHVSDVRAQEFQKIQGEGSSWAFPAIDDMRINVAQFGIELNFNASGSDAGRANFINGQTDFAASDIPFQFAPEDGSGAEKPEPGSYAYIPVVAGGTAFVYNLKIGGKPVTNLRLSGENVAKIFTGAITMWDDPALAADNPGLVLPARTIVPVVRSDGSGSTAQFTRWMIDRHPAIWNDFCERAGRAPKCGVTSNYPTYHGMNGQLGDSGVVLQVKGAQSEGLIGYVNYSYSLDNKVAVVKVLNAAGFYTEPTPENVAVSLLKADINRDESNPALYLTQELGRVYTDTDPRNYQLSSYSYFILPTKIFGRLNEDKGYTLSVFANYAMCQAQRNSAALGYSPMPISLVRPSLEQIRKIPGAVVEDIDVSQCDNPTFDPANPDDPNRMASIAPMPQECDRQGAFQCPDGTGGLRDTPTAVLTPPPDGGGGGGGGGGTGGDSGTGDGSTGDADGGGATDGEAGTGSTGDAPAGANGSPASGSGSPAAGSGATTGSTTTTVAGGLTGSRTNTGAGALGEGNTSAGGDPAIGANCDPDTGECTAGAVDGAPVDPSTGQAAAPGGAAAGAVTPTNLDGGPGFGQAVLIVLVVLLVLALVLGPAFAWRYFSVRAAT